MSYIIWAVLAVYCILVIRKKIKDIKEGRYCNCSECDGSCGRIRNE